MKNNPYIDNIRGIVKIAYERNVDMGVALAIYLYEMDGMDLAPNSDRAAAINEFGVYIRGRKWDINGNEIIG